MQNNLFYKILLASLLATTSVYAQTAAPDVAPDLTGQQAVDFAARASLNNMALTPLPGLNETNISGPVPMAPSVSTKDMPSERLIGRLTPEVFQEMAELERDNTFLKLQIQKETMKNDLEKLRANYRQERLDEIAKREEVVRARIQWWQEQEKIRQDLESQREALMGDEDKAQKIANAETEEDVPEDIEELAKAAATESDYILLNVKGTRGVLSAQVRHKKTQKIITVQQGDLLENGFEVMFVSPTQVILEDSESQQIINFDD